MKKGLLAAAMIVAVATCPRTVATQSATATCSLGFSSPLFVPITGTLGSVVIDDACQNVYLTNNTWNRVERISLQTLTLGTPIQVGSLPVGLDLRPGTNLLYVANSGGNNISVVDIAQGIELRKIITPTQDFNTDCPFFIAIANNGLALVSTDSIGSTGGSVIQLDLNTEVAALRPDRPFILGFDGIRLRAAADRSAIAIALTSLSPSSVFRYSAVSNTFGAERRLDNSVSDIAASRTGSRLFPAGYQAEVLDANLNVLGRYGESSEGSVAVSPDGSLGYRSRPSAIDVVSLQTFAKIGQLAVGDTLTWQFPYWVGQMAISGDGRLIAVMTDHGVSLVATGYTGN
jgi:hypothetical protein